MPEQSVGDLVVYLGGENLHLDRAVNSSIDQLTRLESSLNRVAGAFEGVRQQEGRLNQENVQRQQRPPEVDFATERNKMLLARHAARILPMPGMVGEINFLMHAMRGFGLAVGAAVASVFTLGTAFVSLAVRTKENRQAWHDWNMELTASSRQSAALAKAQTPMTEFGKKMGESAEESGTSWRKMVADNEHAVHEMTGTWLGFFSLERINLGFERFVLGKGIGDTTWGQKQKILAERVHEMRRIEEQGDAERERGIQIQLVRNREDRAATEQGLRINTMWEGPAKKRISLEHEISNERRAMQREEADALRAQAVHQNMAWKAAIGTTTFARDWPVQAAKLAAARQALEEDQAGKRESFDKQAAQRRLIIERDIQEERRQETISADQAVIQATTLGFDRQIQIIQYASQRKMEEYRRAGRDTTQLERQTQAEIAAAYRDRFITISDMIQDMNLKTEFATFGMTQSMTEWIKLTRHLTRELGLSKSEIEDIGRAFNRAQRAQANKPLLDEIRTTQVETARLRGEISLMQAEYLKIRLQHPEASPDLAWKTARMRMLQQMMQPVNTGQFGETYQVGAVDFAALNPQRLAQQNVMRGLDIGMAGEPGQVGAIDLNRLTNTPTDLVVGTVEKSNELLANIDRSIQQLVAKEGIQ